MTMNNYVYIGKIVNTHGIKGELRLLSDFERKNVVFRENFNIYIGNNYIKEVINSYRHHKIFDMITLKNYSNINDVLKYVGLPVYVKRSDLNLGNGEYLMSDLINFNIVSDKEILGKVKSIVYNKSNILLEISYTKNYYIPFVDSFIIKVDIENKCIYVNNAKDLIL